LKILCKREWFHTALSESQRDELQKMM